MNNTINGRTPDEIKKGLNHCSEDGCKQCPYKYDCDMADGFSVLAGDALAYIHRLEHHISELTENVAQLEVAQPKWISVEERLPERGVYFVRCIHNYTDNDEYEIYKVAIYLSKECRWIDVGNLLKVTHWMPMPELPKDAKEEN